MGSGSRIDPATGRKAREANAMFRRRDRDRAPDPDGQGGHGIRRWNGAPAESRLAWRRRETVRRGA